MAFVTSPSTISTNKVSTTYAVSTACTQSSTANTEVSTASLSDATMYAFLSNQSNGSQLVHKELEQIHEGDLEKIDLKWKLALLSMRAKRDSEISGLKSELENLKKEKESTQLKLENFDHASKSIDKLLRSQITDKSRKGVGFESYNVVPPLPIGLFSPIKIDLSYSGLEEFQQPEFESYGPKSCKIESKNVCKNTPNELKESTKVKESSDVLLVKKLVSDDKLEKKIVVPTAAKKEFVKDKQ
uniref:Uncharacterized protein n=1 Tax=Tanacetum cinerariifolium TaxID=118510 RepID=A0A6L2LCH7_TANCI|nr:hypothetical protein [Tanacetum cinerariifolium]